MSDRLRIGVGALVVAAAVVLFLVLKGGSSSSDKKETLNGKTVKGVPTIVLDANGDPVGGEQSLKVTSGDRVRFKVKSGRQGHVHVHGYDYLKPIKAGGTVTFDFAANLQGVFEVELHRAGGENSIGTLSVEPR
jgi:hypothetical protein